jgi:outer membrane autotransporter protein
MSHDRQKLFAYPEHVRPSDAVVVRLARPLRHSLLGHGDDRRPKRAAFPPPAFPQKRRPSHGFHARYGTGVARARMSRFVENRHEGARQIRPGPRSATIEASMLHSNMFLRPHRKTRATLAALLTSTAIYGVVPAAAQEVIDGTTETVNGAGGGTQASPWVIGGSLTVADTGTGGLEIINAGEIESGEGFVGREASADGTVTVDGTGSDWTLGNQLWVGYEGRGEMTISDGASVSDWTGNIAYGVDSWGRVTVTGAGSSWNQIYTVYVSEGGEGYLTVEDQGSVNITGTSGGMRIANDTGAYGEALVTGAGSNITGTGDLFVGYAGEGLLNIENSGLVSMRDATIGQVSGSVGTLHVKTSGVLDLGANLVVGNFGGSNGTLNVTEGGEVDVSDDIFIGDYAGSQGSILVTGAGSLLEGHMLLVGERGTGSLTISDGANVETTSRTAVGSGIGSDGTVVIDGGTLSSGFGFFVGDQGVGRLTVQDGTLEVNHETQIGRNAGSSGELGMTGGVWDTNGDVFVGVAGRGLVTIGGTANATFGSGADLFVGSDAGGEGRFMVDGGSLHVTGDANVGSTGGNGILTVANDGSVIIDGTLFLSDANDSSGKLVIGADAGDGAIEAGAFSAAAIEFGSTGDAGIVFNHDSSNYLFAADISGDGDIDVYAGETVYAGTATHTGSTTIHGGSFLVNGSVGDVVLIGTGLLGGSGTVGGVAIGAGSMIAPGNSVGTLATGPITFSTGSFYDVELNNGGFVAGVNNDLIDVTGVATIVGGIVRVSAENGTDDGTGYTFGTYTILSASGGVDGQFDGVSDNYVFLKFSLDYDPNNVFLISELGQLTDVAQTPNQFATGEAVNSLGSGDPLYDAIVTLVGDDDDARAAFDQLSGEIHATTRSMIVESAGRLRRTTTDRIRASFGDDTGSGPDWWGSVHGDISHTSSDGNAGSYDRTAGGLATGIDGAVSDALRLGVMAAYTASSVDSDERASSASIDSFEVGVYGGAMAGGLSWRFGGSLGWHEIDTTRTPSFAGFSDRLTAGYSATSAQVFGEVSRQFDGGGFTFEPYAGLAHVHVSSDQFAETGGDAALSGSIGGMDTTFTTLGLRGARETLLGDTSTRLSGGIGWRHAFGDITPTTVNSFSTGTAFTVAGAPVAQDALLVDLGAEFALGEGTSLDLGYAAEFGSGLSNHNMTATLSHRF